MRWLHCLLHNCNQILTDLAQIHFTVQGCSERGNDTCCIIAATIETAINYGLDAPPQGLDQSRDDQGGGNDGERRVLLDDSTQEKLRHEDEAKVEQGHYG